MSEIKYGLISDTDARAIEKTIDLLKESGSFFINILEVGVYAGETGNAMREYAKSKGLEVCLTGIDNRKDGEEIRYEYDQLIIGNSNEVYNQIPDNSQHLIFMDGCHCFAHVVSDFFCYASKVKTGGYMAWHDSAAHIKKFKDFQHGDKENPDAYISVRKALYELGLIILEGDRQWTGKYGRHFQWATGNRNECWELIYDIADPENEAGGVTIFKKLY